MNPKNHLLFIMLLSLLITAAFFSSLPAEGAETADIKVVPCDCRAYVVDTDPAGTNVRGGPGTTYPVVTTLPTNRPVEVTITGSDGAWVRISGAYIFIDDAETGDVTMDLEGWIYAPLLAVATRPSGRMMIPLFADPGVPSSVVLELPMETEVTLAGCKGRWVKVRYRAIEGWLDPDSHCGNPVTTCP